jgi:predicted dehydrogenase
VHVRSPNGLHVEHVEAALKAGAHVICEKPLAIGSKASAALAAKAADRNRVATTG